METQAIYTITAERRHTEQVTLCEHRLLKRLRQLQRQGSELIIIEIQDGKLRLRTVGKAEG